MRYVKVHKVKPMSQVEYLKILGEVLKTIEPENKQAREDLAKFLPVRTNPKRGAE
jgi:hypothetical protein